MDSVKPRYSKDEFARRGTPFMRRIFFPKLTAKDVGKFLAIDIETGEYEISADEMKAGDKPRARIPEAQIWVERIGYATAHRFGCRHYRIVERDAVFGYDRLGKFDRPRGDVPVALCRALEPRPRRSHVP